MIDGKVDGLCRRSAKLLPGVRKTDGSVPPRACRCCILALVSFGKRAGLRSIALAFTRIAASSETGLRHWVEDV
jgi:hypothetical protein